MKQVYQLFAAATIVVVGATNLAATQHLSCRFLRYSPVRLS